MNAPDRCRCASLRSPTAVGAAARSRPAVLQQIIAKAQPGALPRALLVGIETSDDAAVYQINDQQAIVATTDFFMPIVDDPHDFGAIAATNAISDVYAMGGTPLFALALVGMPINAIPLAMIRDILAGGESVCARAGIPIAGGHTIDSVEPIYGLVAVGLVTRPTSSATPAHGPATSSSSASRSASACTARRSRRKSYRRTITER